ncbi:FkbM family methyltransferase [Sphingobium indicum]|uniref:FkbM family methyltransferase n=1 Tax=Sphingobium indicum TaxID=332055 RepID=UPI0009FBB335
MVDHFEVNHSRLDDHFLFSCSGDLDTVGNTVRSQGLSSYEASFTNIFIEIAKDMPGVILDVGANTGIFTLAAVAANRSTRVIAFEPLESVRDLLKINVGLNPELAQRVAIEPVGLSNVCGSFNFYETINDCGFISTSSSLEQRHAEAVGGSYVERTIRTITLDEFGDTLGNFNVTFMKIDIEGHEHALITGGRRFISKHRPIFTLEILGDSTTESIDNLLLEGNYFSFAMAPGLLRQCDRMRFFPDAWNHLLVPAEKLSYIFTLCRRLGLQIELC